MGVIERDMFHPEKFLKIQTECFFEVFYVYIHNPSVIKFKQSSSVSYIPNVELSADKIHVYINNVCVLKIIQHMCVKNNSAHRFVHR
jgi:hypothetical protein